MQWIPLPCGWLRSDCNSPTEVAIKSEDVQVDLDGLFPFGVSVSLTVKKLLAMSCSSDHLEVKEFHSSG